MQRLKINSISNPKICDSYFPSLLYLKKKKVKMYNISLSHLLKNIFVFIIILRVFVTMCNFLRANNIIIVLISSMKVNFLYLTNYIL